MDSAVNTRQADPHANPALSPQEMDLVARAKRSGLILIPCGPDQNVIRFLMPLTITKRTLNRGLDILEGALTEAVAGRRCW